MTYDFAPYWAAWASGEWEASTKAWLESVLQPGDLFVDIGAYVGGVTLWALEMGAYCIAVEPDPVAYRELERVTGEWDAAERRPYELWPGAVVAEPGEEAWLAPSPRAGGELGDSQSLLGVELPEARRVDSYTLPEILDGRIPVAVKIDVEGYETRLAPKLIPFLLDRHCAVQVSCHGVLPFYEGEREDAAIEFTPDPRWGDLRITPR